MCFEINNISFSRVKFTYKIILVIDKIIKNKIFYIYYYNFIIINMKNKIKQKNII